MARYLLILLFFIAGCRKEKADPDPQLYGEWKWVVRYYMTSPPVTQGPTDDRIFFGVDGHFSHFINGEQVEDGSYRTHRETAPNDALVNILELYTGRNRSSISYDIYNDTLRLSNDYQGIVGGMSTLYTREK